MPGSPHQKQAGNPGIEVVPEGAVGLADHSPAIAVGGSLSAEMSEPDGASHTLDAAAGDPKDHVTASGDAAESAYQYEDDEEVLGGGCVVVNGTVPPAAALPSATEDGADADAKPKASTDNAPAVTSSGIGSAAPPSAKAPDGSSAGGASDLRSEAQVLSASLKSPSLQIEASSLIPPSLQDPLAAYSALLPGKSDAGAGSAFEALYMGDGADATPIDDNWPVTSPEDYAAVTREAHAHWRARSKQPDEILDH
ncbi:hypothetical protein GGI07_003003, partial [Coemansia sp. Benny D115]